MSTVENFGALVPLKLILNCFEGNPWRVLNERKCGTHIYINGLGLHESTKETNRNIKINKSGNIDFRYKRV